MTKLLRPIASLLVAALVAGGIFYVATRDEDGAYNVTAYFEKAIGLFPNSDVTILGVAVGKVQTVEPVGPRVKVEMEIDDDHKVPADATAHIVPISVISDRYIQLEPVYESGPTLRDGAVLDVEDTEIPAELDDVFKQLKKLLDAIEPGEEGEPGALGDLVVQLNETLKDREEELQGTLIHAADLTQTLATAREDLSGVLVNLDELFGRLATRASSLGTLNRNFAIVMEALAESRLDLEDMVANLADMTNEVGDLVRDHRSRLGKDLVLASKITSAILRNRASVEESLQWLPVVAIGLKNAHAPGEVNATDVRDNASARFDCSDFDDFPDPIGDVLQEICEESKPRTDARAAAPAPLEELKPDDLDCDKGVKRVKRQIRRIEAIDVPDQVRDGVLEPLKRQLKKLKKACKKLRDALDDPDDIVDKLLDKVDGIPEIDEIVDGVDELTGSAADGVVAPSASDDDDDGFWSGLGDWLGGWSGFLGWSP